MLKIKFILFACISINIIHAQKTSSRFILNGKITGRDRGSIILYYISNKEERIADTAFIKKGIFSFSGYIDKLSYANLIGTATTKALKKMNSKGIYLEPKIMSVELAENDFKNAKIKGSHTQEEQEWLEMEKRTISKQLEPMEKEFDEKAAILKKNKDDKIIENELEAVRTQIFSLEKEEEKIDLKFIASHPTSYISADRLSYYTSRLPLDSVKMFYSSFSVSVKNSPNGKEIAALINSSPGAVAKDFSTSDINGNTISLSTFRGKKLVLLDFWATWCVPCRGNSPHLIDLYNNYHTKGLEIISVANDDTRKEAWKKAISDDKTGIWNHVLQGVDSKNDIGKEFGITPIPAKILIDRNGIIIFRNEGDNDKLLDKKLAEVFN